MLLKYCSCKNIGIHVLYISGKNVYYRLYKISGASWDRAYAFCVKLHIGNSYLNLFTQGHSLKFTTLENRLKFMKMSYAIEQRTNDYRGYR